MELLPHQQRVVEEKAELDIKLEKLTTFLSSDMLKRIDDAEALRLVRQSNIMRRYSDVLDQRIKAFTE